MLDIEDYDIKELIHEGIKNVVFSAKRRADNQPVILKTPNIDTPSAQELLSYRKEYQYLTTLKEIEGVVDVYELQESENTAILVMADNNSKALIGYIHSNHFDVIDSIRIAIKLAALIDQLHQKEIVHKDINPHNILWNEARKEAYLIDFGIASSLSSEHHNFQSIHQLEGSIAYISPEQTGRVNRPLDYRSDLYSLGVTLYQLFTGQLPFKMEHSIECVHAHIAQIAVAPHQVNKSIPLAISQIIMKLMNKMADERYQTASSLKSDLDFCLAAIKQSSPLDNFIPGKYDLSPILHIPQKLYGREKETQSLLDSFERICQGSSELVLVTGFAGTGKTVLVQELYKPLTEKRGNFISGKFDQYQRDVPYYAWRKVLESFLQLLLKEDQSVIEMWRLKISEALGEIGAVILELVPEFEFFLGKQTSVPSLSGEQALNRFHYVFGELINAISTEEQPLIIFVDDWHWADASSINLLKYLVSMADNQYLLIIASWRDNEVDNTHLYTLALNEIRKNLVNINEIYIDNLNMMNVEDLINDTLQQPENSDELIQLIYEKTLGNAFFLRQFIKRLYRESLLHINQDLHCWQWDIEKIHEKKITNNVVQLMSDAIQTMESDTQNALRLGACIGNKFDIHALSIILEQSKERTSEMLEPAINQGILFPIKQQSFTDAFDNDVYQFIHDRVQQAAYNLIEDTKRVQTHYQIAKILLNKLDTFEHIFEITNHINQAKEIFIDSHEQNILIQNNLLAGKKAKQGNAYRSAFNYFSNAISLITNNDWQDNLEQMSELFLLATETAYLVTEYVSMESWMDVYLQHNDDALAQVDAYEIRLQAFISQNRLSEAVDTALFSLNLLGVKLPKKPNAIQVMTKLLLTQKDLLGKTFDQLLELPAMEDPKKLKIMNLLGLTIPPAYWTSQELVALIVFEMVRGTVNHGYYPNSGYAISWWGIILGALLEKIEQGFEFGGFGETIAKKHQLNLEQPVFFKGWIIHHLKQPLAETIDILSQAYHLAMEKGNFEYASYALNNNMQARFHTSEPLPELLEKMHSAHQDLEKFKVGSSLYWHDIWWQTALNLNDSSTPCVYELNGLAYNETENVKTHLSVNDASTLFLFYTAKLMLSIIFNQHKQAEEFAQKARLYLKSGAGMFAFVLFYYYESLTLLQQAQDKGYYTKKSLLSRVRRNLKKLRKWAKYSPENHNHRLFLVKAEYYRIANKPEKVQSYYDLAIDEAESNYFIHDVAVCYEYAAKYYQTIGQHRFEHLLLQRSLNYYREWGAHTKVKQLLEEHQFLKTYFGSTSSLQDISNIEFTSSNNSSLELDIQSLLKGYQAISSVIVLDELIKNLLINMMENAGAEKALFLLNRKNGLCVEGQAFVSEDKQQEMSILQSLKLNDANHLLPIWVVNYVKNSQEPVVLNNAKESEQFAQDPYIIKYSPVSILCVPIVKQGELSGIVYLENNLTVGAFTEDRLEFLKLLMAQVAFSIENATVYEQLEDKVSERTKELDNAYSKLREAHNKLEIQAKTDALTQLANRHYFNELAQYQFNQCIREEKVMSILMTDVDNFKAFNDRYGHVKGDECLKIVARHFKEVFTRKTDLVARYGGEEFVVVLPHIDQIEALGMAERLRSSIEKHAIENLGNGDYKVVTISMGLMTILPKKINTIDELLLKADEALYKAKILGRNRVVVGY